MTQLRVCYSAEEAFRKEGGGGRGEDLNITITNNDLRQNALQFAP